MGQLRRHVWVYFCLVGLLTLPFWIAGAMVDARLMPGLSVSAFAIIVPVICASIVSAATGGRTALGQLFASLGKRGRRMGLLGLISIAIPSGVAALSWAFATPADRAIVAPVTLLALVPVFIIAAIAEELGWTSFATQKLLNSGLTPISVGLLVGLVWALWHIPSLIELGRSAEWIAWWSLWTLAQRTCMVFLYVEGGSWVWTALLFHAASNTAWQAAPNSFNPAIEGLAMTAIALVVVLASSRRTA